MGYHHRTESDSTGTAVVVFAVLLILGVLGLLVVGGAGFFWVVAEQRVEHVVAREQQLMAEAERARAEEARAHAIQAQQQAERQLRDARQEAAGAESISTPDDTRLRMNITLDADGTAWIDGEPIPAEELKARLAKQQETTHNAFTVCFQVDPACPVEHLIPLLGACEEVGDIDVRVVSMPESTGEAAEASS